MYSDGRHSPVVHYLFHCIYNAEKCFGCRTKLPGGFSLLRDNTLPKLEAVILL